ncbi:MAG: GGDEF domain-containing protein [Pseudomonadota bacterium]|nr:GGDEF domain-containing protein [Pseudomonadota bacterium]
METAAVFLTAVGPGAVLLSVKARFWGFEMDDSAHDFADLPVAQGSEEPCQPKGAAAGYKVGVARPVQVNRAILSVRLDDSTDHSGAAFVHPGDVPPVAPPRSNMGSDISVAGDGGKVTSVAFPPSQTPIELWQTFSAIMPLFVFVDASGRIRKIGPTLEKVLPGAAQRCDAFAQHFAPKYPQRHAVDHFRHLAPGSTLHLRLRSHPQIGLRAVVSPLAGGTLLNVSFGASIAEAMRCFDLLLTVFPATELAVDMLYQLEAKSAAMAASLRLAQQMRGARDEAEVRAATDSLTGLCNRRVFEEQLNQLCSNGNPFSLMLMDLDHFKQVNDRLGHPGGDYVLQQVAAILQQELRQEDTIVRLGGDEFAIILRDIADQERLRCIALRLKNRLQEQVSFEGQNYRISASFGLLCICDDDITNPQQMLADADRALYSSKRAGRGRVTFHNRETV